MSRKILYALWAGMFILCAGLGFIPEPEGALQIVLTVLSVVFFLPPMLLIRDGEQETVKLVRNLSALSLVLTALVLIANFLCAFGSEVLGDVMHFILVIVSTPMIAGGAWAVSLFLWACLLMMSVQKAGGKTAS